MSAFDPHRIHHTYNIPAPFGGTHPTVQHCHHCVGHNCTGTCLTTRDSGPVGCVHSGIPTQETNNHG